MTILKNLFLMKYPNVSYSTGLVCSSYKAVLEERELISSLMLACLISCFFSPSPNSSQKQNAKDNST